MPDEHADVAVHKVLVYVVRHRAGQLELLVHEHRDAPDAGVQVPAGTIEPHESPADAAARELFEESGLRLADNARVIRAYRWHNAATARWNLRHVFLVHLDDPRDHWTHTITGNGEDRDMVFCYRWIPLADAERELCGDQGGSVRYISSIGARAMSDLKIRDATEADLVAINDIYNHYVLNSTCTYQEEPETMDGRRAWFAAHGAAHPVTVATLDGEVVGWGALTPYHRRAAYRNTVENSVYIAPAHHGRGIGKLLLADLIERAKAIGHHAIIAVIDGDQPGSIALHERYGFTRVGLMPEIGFKFGRWCDVHYLQLMVLTT